MYDGGQYVVVLVVAERFAVVFEDGVHSLCYLYGELKYLMFFYVYNEVC
jgi:hypothetical protein